MKPENLKELRRRFYAGSLTESELKAVIVIDILEERIELERERRLKRLERESGVGHAEDEKENGRR